MKKLILTWLLLVAAMLAMALPLALGCSPAATPEASGAQAMQLTRLGYSAAAVTVRALADLHLDLAKAVQTPEQAAVAAVPLRKLLGTIEAAHSALALARPHLEPGGDEAKALELLQLGVKHLDEAQPLLNALGAKPPKEVTEALGYLRGFVGGCVVTPGEAISLAGALARVALKIPDAVDQVKSWFGGGARPDAVLAELPDLERNRIEQARVEALAAVDGP